MENIIRESYYTLEKYVKLFKGYGIDMWIKTNLWIPC